jgi:hypothetical protein
LQAKEHSAEHLDTVLKVGREVITQAISQMYEKVRAEEEEPVKVQRGSVLVMRLGKTTLDVFEKDYYYKRYTGLDYSSQGLKPKYLEYFEAVRSNVFIPEIRETSGTSDIAGTSLFVRDAPPEDHHFFLRRSKDETVWENADDWWGRGYNIAMRIMKGTY